MSNRASTYFTILGEARISPVSRVFFYFAGSRLSHTLLRTTMASRAQRIAAVAREIFGTLPNRNARSGAQMLKKPLVSHYHERWYMDPIEPSARAVSVHAQCFDVRPTEASVVHYIRNETTVMFCMVCMVPFVLRGKS